MDESNRKSNLKMAGRGSLKKEETIQSEGQSYWKSHGSGGSSLLDHSEKKDHVKEYSLGGSNSQLKKSDGGLRKKTGLKGSGSRYVARMR